MLLAAGGTAGYLLVGQVHAARHASRLSARVASVQSVGLAAPGRASQAAAGTAAKLLLASPRGLAFRPAKPADLPAGYPEWTADQMVGGSYIFIYISTGRCLSPTSGQATLQRCDLSERQRWTREYHGTDASGQELWHLRNAADGRCLTVGSPVAAAASAGSAGSGAELQRCGNGVSWRQLMAFWSGY